MRRLRVTPAPVTAMDTALHQLVLAKVTQGAVGLFISVVAIAIGVRLGTALDRQGWTSVRLATDRSLQRWFFWGGTGILLAGFVTIEIWARIGPAPLWDEFLEPVLLVAFRSLFLGLLAFEWRLAGTLTTRLRVLAVVVVIVGLALSVREIFLLTPAAVAVERPQLAATGVVRQTTGFTCGPCSLANVARLYGRPVTEYEAAIAAGVGCGGSSLHEMRGGAQKLGFAEAHEWLTDLPTIASADRPLLLSVKLYDVFDYHAVALVGISSTSVIIADSLRGLLEWSTVQLAQEWRGRAVWLGVPAFAASSSVRLSTFDRDRFRRDSVALGWPRPRSR